MEDFTLAGPFTTNVTKLFSLSDKPQNGPERKDTFKYTFPIHHGLRQGADSEAEKCQGCPILSSSAPTSQAF